MGKIIPTILRFAEITSTNDFLKENHEDLPDFTVVTCESQTKGRGQFERRWISDPGKNLLVSVLLKQEHNNEELIKITASSILLTLQAVNVSAYIKPPNDIMVNNHKIAGILIERLFEGNIHLATIIGVGLNINQTDFQGLEATSVLMEVNKMHDVDQIFELWLEMFGTEYEKLIDK